MLALGLAMPTATRSQTNAGAAPEAPNERAKREAEKVYQMILLHADKPRKQRDERTKTTPPVRPPGHSAVVDRDVTKPPAVAVRASAAVAQPVVAAEVPTSTPPTMAVDVAAVPAAIATSASAITVEAPSVPAASVSNAEAQGSAASNAEKIGVQPPQVAGRSVLELVSSLEPDFPSHLVRRLGKGSVVVKFDVLPDGSVGQVAIAKTSHQGLNTAALSAVAAWRFKPINETTAGVTELSFE